MTPQTNKYFLVITKCGHVGRGNYVPVSFAVKADSASEASQRALTFPRVKKQLKDAIISCTPINKREYKELRKTNQKDPYLNSRTKSQQNSHPEIESMIMKNEVIQKKRKYEPVKSMKYKRFKYDLGGSLHNVCCCYGMEDDYEDLY